MTWQGYRAAYLRAHPFCVLCADEGLLTRATVVDHKVPHEGSRALFWNPANHQALCKSCHDAKTATENRMP
jgi:5-methylcytosine-specific restriction protein A